MKNYRNGFVLFCAFWGMLWAYAQAESADTVQGVSITQPNSTITSGSASQQGGGNTQAAPPFLMGGANNANPPGIPGNPKPNGGLFAPGPGSPWAQIQGQGNAQSPNGGPFTPGPGSPWARQGNSPSSNGLPNQQGNFQPPINLPNQNVTSASGTSAAPTTPQRWVPGHWEQLNGTQVWIRGHYE